LHWWMVGYHGNCCWGVERVDIEHASWGSCIRSVCGIEAAHCLRSLFCLGPYWKWKRLSTNCTMIFVCNKNTVGAHYRMDGEGCAQYLHRTGCSGSASTGPQPQNWTHQTLTWKEDIELQRSLELARSMCIMSIYKVRPHTVRDVLLYHWNLWLRFQNAGASPVEQVTDGKAVYKMWHMLMCDKAMKCGPAVNHLEFRW
jgi:hypothetical protein